MRRTVTLSVALVLAVAVPPAFASEGEFMYLSDTHYRAHPNHTAHTHLFRVLLEEDPGTGNEVAVLEPLTTIPLAEAQAIACTPDGRRIYAFDTSGYGFAGTSEMGYYDIDAGTWKAVDIVRYDGDPLIGMVLAAFHPDGRLIVGSQLHDMLFEVDRSTAVATPIGQIFDNDGDILDLFGADFAFDAFGTCYLWTNQNGFVGSDPAYRGLYRLNLPGSPGPITANFIGNVAGDFFTGAAIRGNGWGNLAFSSTQPGNQIHVHDVDTGADLGAPRQMIEGGTPYTSYQYGDMTNGPLAPWGCPRTIGYWKNHAWPVDVTLCNGDDRVVIDDQLGRRHILRGAKNRDYSMLTAQLIAAKLNTMNTSGIPFIDDAEAYLCSKVNTDSTAWWTTDFAGNDDKNEATSHKNQLDAFNNNGPCGSLR